MKLFKSYLKIGFVVCSVNLFSTEASKTTKSTRSVYEDVNFAQKRLSDFNNKRQKNKKKSKKKQANDFQGKVASLKLLLDPSQIRILLREIQDMHKFDFVTDNDLLQSEISKRLITLLKYQSISDLLKINVLNFIAENYSSLDKLQNSIKEAKGVRVVLAYLSSDNEYDLRCAATNAVGTLIHNNSSLRRFFEKEDLLTQLIKSFDKPLPEAASLRDHLPVLKKAKGMYTYPKGFYSLIL